MRGASTTSTSKLTVLPSTSIGRSCKIPYGWNPLPSKALRIVGDWLSVGEPSDLQQFNDIIHVDAPSSITVQKQRLFLLVLESEKPYDGGVSV